MQPSIRECLDDCNYTIQKGENKTNRGFYTSAHVLLNFLNELGKEMKSEA